MLMVLTLVLSSALAVDRLSLARLALWPHWQSCTVGPDAPACSGETTPSDRAWYANMDELEIRGNWSRVALFPWRVGKTHVPPVREHEVDSLGHRACSYLDKVQAAASHAESAVTELALTISHPRAFSSLFVQSLRLGLSAGVWSGGEVSRLGNCPDFLDEGLPTNTMYENFLARVARVRRGADETVLFGQGRVGGLVNEAMCNVLRAVSACATGSDRLHSASAGLQADTPYLPDFENFTYPHALTRISSTRPALELVVPLFDFTPGRKNITASFKFFWEHVTARRSDGSLLYLSDIAFQDPRNASVPPTSPDVEALIDVLAPERIISLQRHGIFDAYVSNILAVKAQYWGVTGRYDGTARDKMSEQKWRWDGNDFVAYALIMHRLALMVRTRWPDCIKVVSEDWMADPVGETEQLIRQLTQLSNGTELQRGLTAAHDELISFASTEIVPLDPRGERARTMRRVTERCSNFGEFSQIVAANGWGKEIGL